MINVDELKQGDILFYYDKSHREKIRRIFFLCINPLDSESVLFINNTDGEHHYVIEVSIYSFLYSDECFSRNVKDLLVLLEEEKKIIYDFIL